MVDDLPGPCGAARTSGTPIRAADGNAHATDTVAPSRRGGLYEGGDSVYRVRLFVELDFARDTYRVSGDFFRGEPTAQHVGWFHLPAPRVATTAAAIELEGLGRFTFAARAPLVVLRLARAAPPRSPDRVRLSFLLPDLESGAHYVCTAIAAPPAGQSRDGADGRRVVALADRRQGFWRR